MTDVLVVGAGPAGSSAALRLANAGYDVAILERSRFPRTKVCGEYLSPGACAALASLGVLAEVSQIAHPLRRVVLGGFGAEPVSLRLPGGGALALPRSELDSLLLDAAGKAGVRIIAGTFLEADESRSRVDLRYRDAEGAEHAVSARMLVGADGARSAVAQRMGMSAKPRVGGRWAVGGHQIDPQDGDALEMFVGPGGYYARNPLGRGRTNVMLVLPRPCLGEEAERAVAEITAGRRIFESASLEKRVVVGPLRYAPLSVINGRVLLTGDAAGLLDPFVGQGIAIALEMSMPVASAVTGVLRGNPRSSVERGYASARRAAVLPRTILAAAVDAVIRTRFLRDRAARAVKRNPASAETILASVSGAAPALRAFSPRAIAGLLA